MFNKMPRLQLLRKSAARNSGLTHTTSRNFGRISGHWLEKQHCCTPCTLRIERLDDCARSTVIDLIEGIVSLPSVDLFRFWL